MTRRLLKELVGVNLGKMCGGGDLEEQSLYLKKYSILWSVVTEHEYEICAFIEKYGAENILEQDKLVSRFESLIQVMKWHTRMTPKQVRRRKVELRNAEASISRQQEEIEVVEVDFRDEKLRNREVVEELQTKIHVVSSAIHEMRIRHKQELEYEIETFKTSWRKMVDSDSENEEGLKNRIEAHEAMLEALEKANLDREYNLRKKCKKLERRHLVAKSAYDQDLLKLDELKEALGKQLFVTNEHLEVLQNQFEMQESLYQDLREERELAIMKAFAEAMARFEKNRAARIIQRTWRAYYERVSSRRKKKSRRQASKNKRS
ncbi:hypothetical protein QAD02_000213 [Eretmocerus hayati]|uniref:Uncharacterized protein n=1 Tax=Eretmocerus hayati TaxID=131215 RepID=A0ACC2ND05_9HYME|nr:hypothetical protein QAD02_000213 [Eretmocerus hayati]